MRRNAQKRTLNKFRRTKKPKTPGRGNRLRQGNRPEEGHQTGAGQGKGMDEGTDESRNASPRTGKATCP